MKTLNEIATIFTRLDGHPEDSRQQLDKALRNISQRHYFPPDAQEGKAFLYNEESIVALRLVYVATAFGVDRMEVDAFNRWLRSPGNRKGSGSSGSRIREAIERTNSGENFGFHIVMNAQEVFHHEADWAPDVPVSARVAETLAMSSPAERARFTIPASDLIRDLLSAFEG